MAVLGSQRADHRPPEGAATRHSTMNHQGEGQRGHKEDVREKHRGSEHTMDPFKVLGVQAGSVRVAADLDRVRQRSKELYKRYVHEKKDKEARRVEKAFELIKQKFKRHESASKTAVQSNGGASKAARQSNESAPKAARRSAESASNAARQSNESASKTARQSNESASKNARQRTCSSRGTATPSRGTATPSRGTATPMLAKGVKLFGKRLSTARQPRGPSGTDKQAIVSAAVVAPKSGSAGAPGLTSVVCQCGAQIPRRSRQVAGSLCPACRIRVMDPFNPVLEGHSGMIKLVLVQPPAVPKTARQEARLKIDLNLPRLHSWRKQGQSIEVRMVSLNTNDSHQCWPKALTFTLNDKQVFEIKPPHSLHVRRDLPHQISALLHPGRNRIYVNLKDDYVQRFALAIVRTTSLTLRQLCKKMKLLNEEQCKQRIIELLFSSVLESTGEDVNCVGHDRCRVLCPITLTRIETPARGYKCRHLQCFDLVAYLVSNLRMGAFNKRWLCPVCDMVIKPPKDLFIDTFAVRILKKAEADADELTFAQDGSWWVSRRIEPGSPGDDDEEARESEDAALRARSLQRNSSAEDGLMSTQGTAWVPPDTPDGLLPPDTPLGLRASASMESFPGSLESFPCNGSDDGASSVVLSSVSGEEDLELDDEDDKGCDAISALGATPGETPGGSPSQDSNCSAAVCDPYAICSPVEDCPVEDCPVEDCPVEDCPVEDFEDDELGCASGTVDIIPNGKRMCISDDDL